MEIAEKLIKTHSLTRKEALELLKYWEDPATAAKLVQAAEEIRRKYYGDKVFTRGLIEFTNYCKNNCYYCGIRCGNSHAARYRLTEEEILDCCKSGYDLGFRTFVLQGGEDPFYTDEKVAGLVKKIKASYPDCAVTLSIGEKTKEAYRLFRQGLTGICSAMRQPMRSITGSCIRRP